MKKCQGIPLEKITQSSTYSVGQKVSFFGPLQQKSNDKPNRGKRIFVGWFQNSTSFELAAITFLLLVRFSRSVDDVIFCDKILAAERFL